MAFPLGLLLLGNCDTLAKCNVVEVIVDTAGVADFAEELFLQLEPQMFLLEVGLENFTLRPEFTKKSCVLPPGLLELIERQTLFRLVLLLA